MVRGILFIYGIFILCLQVFCNENSKYDEHLLVRLYPTTDTHIEKLKQLEDIQDIEVLKRSRSFNDSTDVLVHPNQLPALQDVVIKEGINYDVKENYGRSFESVDRTPRRRVFRSFNVFEYHSYAAMQEYLDTLAKRYPDLIKFQTLGTSYQGRRMKLVKISSNPNAGNPIIFIDAGIHAREWVAPAMAMYLIHRLVNDPDARRDLTGVDWYILPVVNPDGYEFTRSNKANRLWRKTRSKNAVFDCFGVDGNRNYGYKWAVSGVSKNPCDKETYAGPKPFSEPETQMVRNVMMEYGKRIKLYVSLHSYGQYLVYPWGYTGDFLPKEWQKLDSLGRMVSEAVVRAGGKPFRVMSAGKWYPAAGGSDDFAFGAVGVPYSYTMELTDGYEFVFPERLLHTVFPQFYEGFRVFATQIKNEFAPSRHKRENLCISKAAQCGCKTLRPCYEDMLEKLLDVEEDACIENVAIGASTITIFLKALQQFCGDYIEVQADALTYENRLLYTVVLNTSNEVDKQPDKKPIIMLEAGQRAGSQPVMMALYVIEQLVACEEYTDMIEKVTWVILPCTNPDGQEYVRCNREEWNKNMVPLENSLGFGVDISRNFDDSWNTCRNPTNIFSPDYPGPTPGSENETMFISTTIAKYKPHVKAYVSLRRDGHSLLYPFASVSGASAELVQTKAGEIAAKVNQRSGSIQWFVNTSIYEMNGKPWCGHSVDYAYNKQGVPYSYEMRVFPESDNSIMSKFQTLPKGYEASLRNAYFTGIKELYNIVSSEQAAHRNLV